MAADNIVGGRAIAPDEFSDMMSFLFRGREPDFSGGMAVGVSGGPDSMALCFLLSQWCAAREGAGPLHVLSIDHGLREESAQEADAVAKAVSGWKGVVHQTLCWAREGDAPDTRIQEAARGARYGLMCRYMQERGLTDLFLAHHKDDQAETVLFRLASGSGLDGMSGMVSRQALKDGIVLWRPLLGVSKVDLVATCDKNNLLYHHDPSNCGQMFARGRLRSSMEALAREGLTADRLSVAAGRFARARAALEDYTAQAKAEALLERDSSRAVLSFSIFKAFPDEIGLRVLLSVMTDLVPSSPYGPRLERVEELFSDLMKPEPFRKRTLNGMIFQRNDKTGQVIIFHEDEKSLKNA